MIKYLLETLGITKFVLAVVGLSSITSISIAGIVLNSVIESYEEEMIRVVAADVHEEIDNELLKPVIVSMTMANDIFLKKSLKNSFSDSRSEEIFSVTEYLSTFKKNFHYSAAFLIVDSSKRYYTAGGFQKVLNWEKNSHDTWYRDFLNMNVEHALHVDTDEANKLAPTIFANTLIKDSDGKILGVCGVGLGMKQVQNILEKYEKKYSIKANLVNSSKIVKVSTDYDLLEKNYPMKLKYQQNDEFVLNKIFGRHGEYAVTKYISDFDWYLVIQRSADNQQNIFKNLVLYITVMWVILLALLLTFIQVSLNKGEKQIEDTATKQAIASQAGLYVSMHLLDLEKNTIHELSSNPEIKIFKVKEGGNAKERLNFAAKRMTSKESLQEIVNFINLKTLQERLQNKNTISQEFLSEQFGWCKAYFMLVEKHKDGRLKKIVFAIELIDEEKRREKH